MKKKSMWECYTTDITKLNENEIHKSLWIYQMLSPATWFLMVVILGLLFQMQYRGCLFN